jgi:archaellum component FlaC
MCRKEVLFDQGPHLYEYCKQIEKKYSEVRRRVMSWKETAVDVQSMQEFQEQWKNLSDMKKLIQEKAGILAEKNWKELYLSSDELDNKIEETLMTLRIVNADLQEIMELDAWMCGKGLS